MGPGTAKPTQSLYDFLSAHPKHRERHANSEFRNVVRNLNRRRPTDHVDARTHAAEAVDGVKRVLYKDAVDINYSACGGIDFGCNGRTYSQDPNAFSREFVEFHNDSNIDTN